MVSDRWLRIGSAFGIIACVALAVACGGGGGGGGASTTVAMALSFPSGAIGKPGSSGGGAIQKTMVSGATATLTTAAGVEYTMTEDTDNPGTYTTAVRGLKEGDALIIEARKGTLELSKLIPQVVILGDGTTYDAGDVDTVSTAFTEIVKEIAETLATDLSLTADVSAGGDLIANLGTITALIDLTQLYTQIVTAIVDSLYDKILVAIETACIAGYNASLIDATIAETSTLTDGTLDRTTVFEPLPSTIESYPEASVGATSALAAGQAFLDALLARNATALSAALAAATLWDGATKAEVVAAWQLDWADLAAEGVASTTFGGALLSQKISETKYKIGLRGMFEDKNSSGTVICWDYMDAFKSGRYWMYAEEISSGVWAVTGNGLKQTVTVAYTCGKEWDSGSTIPGSPSSTSRGVEAGVEQFSTVATLANLILSGTVDGSSDVIMSGPRALTESTDSEDGWDSWWFNETSIGLDPTVGDTLTFYLTYSAGSASPTADVAPFTSLDSLSMMTFNTFSVDASTVNATWTPPVLDHEISEIIAEVCCATAEDTDLLPGTTSVSVSTAGLTTGSHVLQIMYHDIYSNRYKIAKWFNF